MSGRTFKPRAGQTIRHRMYLNEALQTVGRELVSFKHSDTEDVLFKVLNKKLTVGIPLGIQRVLQDKNNKRHDLRQTMTGWQDANDR